MKIPKFLVGGSPSFQVIANPFAVPAEDSATTSSKKSSGKKDGLLSESLLNELYKKGIPVDVDNFVSTLAQYEQQEQWGLGVSPAAIRGLEAQANRIIQQANYLRKAETFAEKNAAIGEIAVGSRGQLYTQDKDGNIRTVGMSEYDPEKHGYALTVGDLIEQRKFNPNKAYDTDLTQTINNNIGMQKINEYIQGIIKTVGSSSTTSEAYTDLAGYVGKQYAKRPTEAELKNLQQLAEAMQQLGPDAIFKNKEIMKSRNIQEAFEYIRSVLPRDMRVQLSGRWVANGGTTDSAGKYMDNIIAQALTAANKTEYGDYLDYDSSVNKAAGTKAGEAEMKPQRQNMTPIEALVQGSLGRIDYNLISTKYPELSITLHGNGSGSLSDVDGNIVPKAPLSVALQNSLLPVVDTNHITMGSEKISPAAFDTILYDGGPVINIWAPVDERGDIDLDRMVQFNEILDYLKKQPELTAADKSQLLQQYGFVGRIDENNQFHGDGQGMAQFLVFTGLTTDKVLDEDTNAFADVLSRDAKKLEKEQIERIYGTLNKGLKQGKYEFKEGFFGSDFIKAPVFMKLSPTAQIDVETFTGHGPVIRNKTYEEMNTYDQARYNRPQVITPSTNILNQYE